MICVTRLNYSNLVLNDDLIEHIEASPDTVISMTTGQNFTVRESPEQIVDRVRAFRRSLSALPDVQTSATGAER